MRRENDDVNDDHRHRTSIEKRAQTTLPLSPTFTNTTNTTTSTSSIDASTGIKSPSPSHRVVSFASDTMNSPKVPLSLEGTLSFRKSRSASGTAAWKQSYVVLNLADNGSITCFRQKPKVLSNEKKNKQNLLDGSYGDDRILPSFRRPLQNKKSLGDSRPQMPGDSLIDYVSEVIERQRSNSQDGIISMSTRSDTADDSASSIRLHLPGYIPWEAKNIGSSSTEFVIEIPTDTNMTTEGCGDFKDQIPEQIAWDFKLARASGKPYRIYFRCAQKSNEKSLWLQALEQIGRLSPDLHEKRGVQSFFHPNIKVSHRRVRNELSKFLAEEGEALCFDDDDNNGFDSSHFDDPGFIQSGCRRDDNGEKEFLVYPMYAYPNRWMTQTELRAEMLKQSSTFHDLRITGSSKQKEIGTLKVEVLECVGLPALDFASETDAVVYLVCGSYAFSTDVIWNHLNPIWLPRTRRACIFPLFHAYARLFVGVFDDDGKNEKDDFAGRVVLDLSRIRPRSTYDVTLPLRLSSQVYSRKPRGAIRLRFSIDWHSDRDAILSYIPKTIKPPPKDRPDNDVTILCADEKAFRNIATTVHGVHMPGRFSVQEFKASMREMNFARKVATNIVRDLLLQIVVWKNPVLSGMVFFAWMHCIYRAAFSLVPFYITFFLFVAMIRTYVFYGSDGPIQHGFIPPSFEEMALSFFTKEDKVIEPLKVRPRKDAGCSIMRTYKSTRIVTSKAKPVTHQQKGKSLFRILGFTSEADTNAEPEVYDMEFPYSQGLVDPISGNVCYTKYKVKESLVFKSKKQGKRLSDDNEYPVDDLSACHSRQLEATRRSSFTMFSRGRSRTPDDEPGRRARSVPPSTFSDVPMNITLRSSSSEFPEMKIEDIPPRLRIPDQDIDSKNPTGQIRKS